MKKQRVDPSPNMTKTSDKSWTKKDFQIDWFSGTGAGGQHRNKHQNCVRVTHIESGITVTGQNHRERSKNFKEAFEELANRIVKWQYGENQKERAPVTDVIRTYNIEDNRITDHITGNKTDFNSFELNKELEEKLSMMNK